MTSLNPLDHYRSFCQYSERVFNTGVKDEDGAIVRCCLPLGLFLVLGREELMTGGAALGRVATTRCSSLMTGGGIARNALAQRAEARQVPGLSKLTFEAETLCGQSAAAHYYVRSPRTSMAVHWKI